MVGGVICGYWAMGRVHTAIPPARVITMDSTAAKIGRSMKKRENMIVSGPWSVVSGRSQKIVPLLTLDLRLLTGRCGEVFRGRLGLDLDAGADALLAADDDPFPRLQAAVDHASAVLERADLDLAVNHFLLVVDDEHELLP